MDIHLQVIRPRDFLIAKANGVLDRDASISILSKIVEAHPEGEDLLIDLRNIKRFATSITDVVEIVTYMLENRRVFRYKIAIIGDPGKANHPGFLEDYATNRGLDLKVFRDFEQAIVWLMRLSSEQ